MIQMVKFCSQCGNPTQKTIPEHDHLLRDICSICGYIHYDNPKIVAGALVTQEQKILLCRRAIEPSYGYWTIPAGYLELGESIQQGAIRECWEEAEAKIEIEQLYCIYNILHVGHIYMLFKAKLCDGCFGIGTESLDSHLFELDKIPWDKLAFPSIERTLQLYIDEQEYGHFSLHIEDFDLKRTQAFYQKYQR